MSSFEYHPHTECGFFREQNQDFFLIDSTIGFFAMADGMGGHDLGGHASKLACQYFYNLIRNRPQSLDVRFFWSMARQTIKHVYEVARDHPKIHKMGTTLSAIVINMDRQRAFITHIGDSRIYQLKSKNEIRQLTEDHTRANQLVRLGLLTPEQAKYSPDRHRLTKSIGTKPTHTPDVFEVFVEKGDVFLLTTDGFHEHVEVNEIRRLLYADVACSKMVDIAIKNGSRDNVTILKVKIPNPDLPPTS
jgi:protein phosphatase